MENKAGVIGLAIVLALILASAAAWIICIVRVSRGAALRYAPRRKVVWGLVDLGLAMALVIAVSLIAGEFLKRSGIDPARPLTELTAAKRATLILVSSLSMLVGVIFSLGLIWLKNRPTLADFGISVGDVVRDLGIGVATFVLVSAPVYAIQYVLVEVLELQSAHPLIELVKRNPDPRFFMVTFVAAVVFAPLTEEFLFRVLLQGWLERIPGHRGDPKILLLGGSDDTSIPLRTRPVESQSVRSGPEPAPQLPDRPPAKSAILAPPPNDVSVTSVDLLEYAPSMWPVIVSSLIFAAAHISHGVDPIPLFVLALGLGFVYRQTHRVLPCIITHMLFNGFSVALLMVEVYGGGQL